MKSKFYSQYFITQQITELEDEYKNIVIVIYRTKIAVNINVQTPK